MKPSERESFVGPRRPPLAGPARSVSALGWALAFTSWITLAGAAESQLLWQIGRPDHGNAEFALAPDGYQRWGQDGFFIIGESDPKRDWPYVHPGPDDGWAGGRAHTFTILFGLKGTVTTGDCALRFDLLDTHSHGPSKLRVDVNGQPFDQALPLGAGDDSVRGQPAKGKPHSFRIVFPAKLLHAGDNEFRITTVQGSWLLYDWVGFEAPPGAALSRVQSHSLLEDVKAVRAVSETEGRQLQPVMVSVRHFGPGADARIGVDGEPSRALRLESGLQTVELSVPAVTTVTQRTVSLLVNGQVAARRALTLKPVRPLTVYVLPHSHTDIGYTEIQTDIEKKQVNNLVTGMAAARRTAPYPEGARFVWNVEVAWAADLYLHRLDKGQRAEFLEAVRQGQVTLNGMYLNELTGLCRPEELLQLFHYATELSTLTGRPIDAAMISDVPGYTWGTVTAMAQAGIRYFSAAPNYFDRIGTILREWENKPFWWVGPDGRSRVLVWIPFWGYAMSHRYGTMSAQLVDDFCDGLEKRSYPYDIAYVRWSGHGDNAVPDPAICDFVKDWNSAHTWPHFVIAGTSEAFRAFERRYGRELPEVRGDWTPYWEDGAGSSAAETALNRASSDRLVQAETLFALLNPAAYPARAFQEAWQHVLLYSEHTWGADVSVSDPECRKTQEQWAIKQGYARLADSASRSLLERALPDGSVSSNLPVRAPSNLRVDSARPNLSDAASAVGEESGAVDLYNTLSWPRTELVILSPALSAPGDRVLDDAGRPVPSQRLTSGELAFLASDVPALAARRFRVTAGPAGVNERARAEGALLSNGRVRARVDEKSGAIAELTVRGLEGSFVDATGGEGINEFLFLPGSELKGLVRNGPVKIVCGETGPLMASLRIESDAPGCHHLRREIRLVAGLDYLELINTVDKQRAAIPAKPGDWQFAQKGGKESVNFAFPFRVPEGEMTLDLPLGWMRPEADQMPSACKNWFTVGRWVEVSNRERGITWVTLDAPLVQVGGITANLVGSQTNPDIWRQHVPRSQRIYSWAMNNHWGTNYRAYQDGPTVFRFFLRPHKPSSPADASRFATGFSQPLQANRARGPKPSARPWLQVEPSDVLVTALKPADDGKGWIIRLFGAAEGSQNARLQWGEATPKAVFLSDTSEHSGAKAGDVIPVPSRGLVTLRAEFP